jgi:hypothetical protein
MLKVVIMLAHVFYKMVMSHLAKHFTSEMFTS